MSQPGCPSELHCDGSQSPLKPFISGVWSPVPLLGRRGQWKVHPQTESNLLFFTFTHWRLSGFGEALSM